MSENQTWLFDLGNTRLKWVRPEALAVVSRSGRSGMTAPRHDVPRATDSTIGSGHSHDVREERHDRHTASSFSAGVHAFAHAGELDVDALLGAFVEIRAGSHAWLASVASPVTRGAIETALGRRGAKVVHVTTQAILAGVRIAYVEPARLGVDRFLALLGAYARARRAWLIVSVGTALTIDLLDADGRHHGGLIAPSPTLMRTSLSQRAPHLPADGGTVLDFAADTADALASGAVLSARALIAHSQRAAKRRLDIRPAVLIAGGGADALLEGWRVRVERAPDLVLEGLSVYASAASELSDR